MFVLAAFCEIRRATYLRVPRVILYLRRYPERVKAGPSPGPWGRMGLPPARAVRSGRKKSLRSLREVVRPSLAKARIVLDAVTDLPQHLEQFMNIGR